MKKIVLLFFLAVSVAYANSFTFKPNDPKVKISGRKKFNQAGALIMDGSSHKITAKNLPQLDMQQGFTIEVVVKKNPLATDSNAGKAYDGFCQKRNSFAFARYKRSFYFLIHNGKKFEKAFLSNAIFPTENDDRPHHIALTGKYHRAVDQGEIWTEIQIFLDGKAVYTTKIPNIRIPDGLNEWEFGSTSSFGKPFNFGGDFYAGAVFPRVLSEKEIRDRVESFSDIVTPDFPIAAKISADQAARLKSLPPEQQSACRALLMRKVKQVGNVLADPEKFLQTFGSDTRLTILNMPGSAAVLSLYDVKNNRELLNWNNPFFLLNFERGNKKATVSMNDLQNTLAEPPVTKNGITSFTILHDRKEFPALSGKSHWTFNGKRLEYSLEIDAKSYATILRSVSMPAINIAPFGGEKCKIIIPEAGGLLYDNAVKAKINYKSEYPRMKTSMQCGAFYDDLGGVYFSPADPLGRAKLYHIRTDSDGAEIKIEMQVAFDARNKNNSFVSKSAAAVEAFKGDWYDVGLLYRAELDRINCVWFRKTLPNTDTPEWMRKNTLGLLMFHMPDIDQALLLRKYLELPFSIQHWYWWERGAGHHLCPLPRHNNEYLAYAQLMQENGIRIINYTNGRLWSSKDIRGEGTLFNTLGKQSAVIKADGSVQMEPYGAPCAVFCPDNDIYRKYMFSLMTRLVGQGVSGCFVDQLGAARPLICQSSKHGHRINDPETWNINGHRKAFLPIRKYWRENNIDAVLFTEDNSEHCVGIIDAMFPWRWMHDNQIPLHAMVYSGRTQYISRDPTGEDMNAPFPKAATQIVQGEQIGHFGIVQFTSPSKGNFRRFVKRLMHLRLSIIDFFDQGMMMRNVNFKKPMKKIYTKWGNHGTKMVGTLPVISGAWQLDGTQIVLLINTTGSVQKNSIADEPGNMIYAFNSSNKKVQNSDFVIEPYGCELRIYGKQLSPERMANIEKCFEVIRRTASEPDLFGIDKVNFSDGEPFDPTQWQQAAASPVVLGARANKDAMVLDNVYYGLFYAGIADFGKGGKGHFDVELTAPSYSGGGNVEIWLDHPDNGKMIGRLICDRKEILTKSWHDYRPYKLKVNQFISGKHKVFFKLNGGSVCNFRNWRWVNGGEK